MLDLVHAVSADHQIKSTGNEHRTIPPITLNILAVCWICIGSMDYLVGTTYAASSVYSVGSPRKTIWPMTASVRKAATSDRRNCTQAKQLYEAASSDARILERAIFVSNFRHEVERALGKQFSNEELRALADQARAEAHRWYRFMQEPEHGCALI